MQFEKKVTLLSLPLFKGLQLPFSQTSNLPSLFFSYATRSKQTGDCCSELISKETYIAVIKGNCYIELRTKTTDVQCTCRCCKLIFTRNDKITSDHTE